MIKVNQIKVTWEAITYLQINPGCCDSNNNKKSKYAGKRINERILNKIRICANYYFFLGTSHKVQASLAHFQLPSIRHYRHQRVIFVYP